MRTHYQQRKRRTELTVLVLLTGLGFVTCLVLGALLWGSNRAALEQLGPASERLNPLERLALYAYLSTRLGDLTTPASEDATAVNFAVEAGATAGQVAQRLAEAGLIRDANLLTLYLRYRGYDNAIEAGDFILRPTLSTAEIAVTLTDANARELSVRLGEGWRVEQMAAALGENTQLTISAESFLALAGPGGARVPGYGFLEELPPGASLEGFLFPDTYILRPNASAEELLRKILTNFEAHVPLDYRARLFENHLTLYQAITIASLIEREAVVDDERPIIASVILNRLTIGQPLEIDATVQYAIATPENWWPPVNGLDFRAIDNPYNTYFVTGLPAGPIANPGEASILAVADPANTNYLYYRALCDGSGRHAFAATFEEHLANACE